MTGDQESYEAIVLHRGYGMREIHRTTIRGHRPTIELLSLDQRRGIFSTPSDLPVQVKADVYRLMYISGKYAFYEGPMP